MYQMLTGELPYGTPSPADMERLMRGELVTPPRVKNSRIPRAINDIVLRALAPDPNVRFQRAADLLNELLAARDTSPPKPVRPAVTSSPGEHVSDIHSRLKAREALQPRFCWHCRKPLHARTDRCPFCGEPQ
jgi:serine/threonine protein kinase